MTRAFSDWLKGLAPYAEKPVLATFLLGMSSGFPLTLVISLTGIWLSRFGVSKETVGIFALATTPYAWKFLWSPAIDRVPLGFLSRYFGRRRAWLVLIQAGLAVAILYLSVLDPAVDTVLIGFVVLAVGFLSASQDTVIDAYRIEVLPKDRLGHGASMVAFGYRAGNLIAGYGVLRVAESAGWSMAIALLVLLLLPGLVAVIWVGEPAHKEDPLLVRDQTLLAKAKGLEKVRLTLHEAVVLPFVEFTHRRDWLLILLFIFLFKAGDAIAAIMTGPLMVDLQFTEGEMANANKLVGTIALWVGIALGAVLYRVAGVYRSLALAGILMMVTNLVFAWLATRGHDVFALAVTIGSENFATGLGTTVVIAYLSSLCNLSFTATQYALLSSLASQARAIMGTFSGVLAENLGWVPFFLFSTLAAVPGLIMLLLLWRRSVGVEQETGQG